MSGRTTGIRILVGIGLAVGIGILTVSSAAGSGESAPRLQPTAFETPTPNADGAILYTVLEGDSLWRIAAIAEISVEELMALNGIQAGDFISPGMELVLGSILLTPTPQATLTPTVQVGPLVGAGDICVLLFTDENGNARLDEGEMALPEGQVSVADRDGNVRGDHTTDDTPEGHCFTELEDGDYNVSAAVPPNFNPTTSMNVPVRLAPGDVKNVQFGGQPSAAMIAINAPGGENSTLLGVLGVFLLVAAGVLGYYAVRAGRTL